ncbi:hypothetical protein H5410_023762 [Solanum commersonii]|uniref:Uncharacterized protein n=1 Tax=Solanum commersonii TaxID=4109 RepID=A0A9J5ZHR6_SOLCO|nr:hypothetical protein H5410_023762 [Solanum commersonii]
MQLKTQGISIVGIEASRVDSRQKLMDTFNFKDAENSVHSRTLSTSRNNSSCSGKGATKNFYDSEKSQDISNASRYLLGSPLALNRKLSPKAFVFVPNKEE